MSKKRENTAFTCANCSADVLAATNGSYRNHCPFCLCSLHLDVKPGDRASDCYGVMMPVGLRKSTKKGWQILHRCTLCGFERYNIVCGDGEQPDDFSLIINLPS